MEHVVLNAEIRAKDERVSDIRKEKLVPCVVYGKKQEPISITIDNSSLLRAYRKAGESTIINLHVGKKELDVIIHDIQRNPVTGDFTHMDFYAVTRGEKLSTYIALNFIGTSSAQKEGAIIQEVLKELEVRCLPRYLVNHFDVDISVLKSEGDSIHVRDLGINLEHYELTNDQDDTVVVASKGVDLAAMEAEMNAEADAAAHPELQEDTKE